VAPVLVNKISELLDKPVVLPSFKVPPFTVVTPLKLLLPESVKVPVPFLVTAIVLEPSWISALIDRLELSPPIVSVTLLAPLLVITPYPATLLVIEFSEIA